MSEYMEEKEYINTIHNSKWEDLMVKLPSDSIDMVITSPVYNVNLGNNKFKKDPYDTCEDNMTHEDYLKWMKSLFTECYRVLKHGGRAVFNIGDGKNGQVPTHADFIHILVRELGFKMMTTIIWDKSQISNRTSWGSWLSPSSPSFPTPFEYIVVVAKGDVKKQGDKSKISVTKENFIKNSLALWKFTPETGMMKKWDHPACFPSELPRRLIDQLSYIDDVILDPFSGSGTTCAVAKEMGRRYIGIEMSEKYWKTSVDRINSVVGKSLEKDENGNDVTKLDWMS